MNPADAMQILAEGMRLVGLCKVLPVPVHQGTTHESKHVPDEAVPASWISQANDALPQLVDLIEDHREVLFAEQPQTQEFRLLFTMVYFEQCSQQNEVARFQLAYNLDLDLYVFEDEVDHILTSERSAAIRHRLFHHYGITLSLQNWYYWPGEMYSFVRMIWFLVEFDRVKFEPNVISFVLDFGKELLGYRASLRIQILGTMLLSAILRQVCKDRHRFESNEELLGLILEMVKKPEKDIGDVLGDLWDMIYYCASLMPGGQNPSLDDAIMGILLGHLIDECELDPTEYLYRLYTYVKTSLRLLLLNIPEVCMDRFDDFSISGRKSSVVEVCKYIKSHCSSTSSTCPRFTARWRFRIGKVIPKLFSRHADEQYYRYLQVLLCVVIYPLAAHWYEQRPQACVVYSVFRELSAALCASLVTVNSKLDEQPEVDMNSLREMMTLNMIYLEYLGIIKDIMLELMARFQQETDMVSSTFTEFSNLTVKLEAMINGVRDKFEKLRKVSSGGNEGAQVAE